MSYQNQIAVPCKINRKILKGETTWNPYNNKFGNIGDAILQIFELNPNCIGQVDAETGEQNTFQQMKERSVKCALAMKKLNIRRNDVVMICSHNQLDACIPFLASLYIGTIISPLDEHLVKGNLIYFLEQNKPKILFIDEKYSLTIYSAYETKNLPQIILFDTDYNIYPTISLKSIMNNSCDSSEIENFCCSVVHMKETAMKLFTPGTTAPPKNIEIPHSAFMASPDQQAPDIRPNDVALWFDSLGFINGIFMTIQAILMRVKVIRIKSNFDAEKLWKLIQQYKVTWIFLETSMCIQLLKSNNLRYDVSSLRTIVYSGSMIDSKFIYDLKILLPKTEILQAYTLTETGIIAYQRKHANIGSNGNVSKNVQLKIISLYNGALLEPYKEGEICCKSPFMMIRRNNELITCDGRSNSNWFRTGDIGYYDSSDEIYVTNRINQMCDKGYRISPTEIESFLNSYLEVSEAVIIPVPCNPDHTIAFVTKVPKKKVKEEKLKQLIVNDLSCNFQLHTDVIFLTQFPRIPNGKIHRKLLHDWAQTYIPTCTKIRKKD